MAVITGTPNTTTQVDVGTTVTSPSVQNVVIAVANTEQSIALPANTRRFRIQTRGTTKFQIAYISGESGTTYFTVWPGAYYTEDDIDAASLILYVQSAAAGEVLEVISWI